MPKQLIKIENVTKKFEHNHVLKGICLCVYKRQITTIIGKSGAGKSVILKHIIGLLKPDTGRIIIKNQDINKVNNKKRREIYNKFSYMFQGNALFDSMTVSNNIALPIKEKNELTKSEIQLRVKKQIEELDLLGVENHYPSQISEGTKKRVAMARALITEPEIVLFDEPTAGLDPIRRNAALTMIKRYQKKLKFSSIIVSHDIPKIFEISHRIAMISDGIIIFEGETKQINKTNNPIIKKFISNIE